MDSSQIRAVLYSKHVYKGEVLGLSNLVSISDEQPLLVQ